MVLAISYRDDPKNQKAVTLLWTVTGVNKNTHTPRMEHCMQRIYIYIIIAAIVFAASYSSTIKNFFNPGERESEAERPVPAAKDDASQRSEMDLYRIAQTFSELQGKTQLLQMAKEKREWFKEDDYANLEVLLEATKKDLAEAEILFKKAQEDFARMAVQKMLEDYSRTQKK